VDGRTFPYEIVPLSASTWSSEITFSSTDPGFVGTVYRTPTLRPAASQLAYSDVTGGSEPLLTIAWDVRGGAIRQVNGRKVLKLAATGRYGPARRTVVVDTIQTAGCPVGGLCSLSDVCGAISLQGGADVTFTGGVTANSTCSQNPMAIDLGNNTTLTADGGIDVVGGYNGAGTTSPAPNTGAQAFDDPLKDLPQWPLPTACDPNHINTRNTSGTYTLTPGVYCGGISFSGTGTTTLAPGDYVIAGGELELSGSHLVTGPGVTFHITQHPTTGQWGSVDIGPSSVSLVAPTTGTYAGILIFQNRSDTNELVIRGTFTTGLDGMIYAATANLDIQDQGGGPKDLNIGMIVGTASFTGDATFNGPTTPSLATTSPRGYQTIAWRDWAS
jgi:hypothetical protein